jgi:hypothetical protein
MVVMPPFLGGTGEWLSLCGAIFPSLGGTGEWLSLMVVTSVSFFSLIVVHSLGS